MAMSMRSRGAAAAGRRTRVGVRPVYEDFKPVSELIQEEGTDVLLYQLPGFVKEQIRIIAESKGLLRVRGERLLGDNKWNRFQEDVMIPEDCKLSEIRAKFEDGVLRIIMPRIKKLEPKQQIIEQEVTEAGEPPSTILTPSSILKKPQLPKGDLTSNTKPQSPLKNMGKKENISAEGASEPLVDEVYDTKIIESNEVGYRGVSTNMKKNNEVKEKFKMVSNENYGTSSVNSLTKGHVTRKLDEDRQLLVNMGVAILVIMALGASISYSLSLGFND